MAAPPQLVGQILGHYRILEQIGAGGMGVVYRAHDEQLERDVAVKVLPVGTLADEAARKRFRKEALALAKLNHPNIATIFEFGSQNSTDYLVTEYISGQRLDEKLAIGALSEKELVGLGIQLAHGLSAAHEHGIVHRDLKPANLRLTSDGRLKILDFGLAQLMPHASEVGMTATLTQSQEVTGTLPYMAPEQLRGEPAEERTDIWAAGAVLYEIATAHRPFEQKMPSALTDDIIHTAPRPPRSLRPALSPKLEAVILKCLAKEPAHRYQSAQELQTDLERLSTGVTPIAARRQLWPMLSVAAVLLALLAAGGVFYLRRSPKLTEKDTIVLADFENKTGDAVFDDTLKQGLSVQLSQSPFLNLLSDQKVSETLKLMGRAPGDRLSQEVAREICVRTNSKAVLAGSISSLGSEYIVGLEAIACGTGDNLAKDQAEATNKEGVLTALDKAVSRLRKKLGESLASVQKFDAPVEATTSSLEALKTYSTGRITHLTKGDAEALPFYERAIELDPNFALAYAGLGVSYLNLGQASVAAENAKKAYDLRDRVSEREKYRISVLYYGVVTGEAEKAIRACESWMQSYPQDIAARAYLANLHSELGQWDEATAQHQETLRLEPNASVVAYGNLAGGYLALNRPDDAKKAIEQAQQHKLDGDYLHQLLYSMAFIRGDTSEMERQVAWAAGRPDAGDAMLSTQSDTEAYYGRLTKARDFSRRAVKSATRAGAKETAALWQVNAALREAEFGNAATARQDVGVALALSRGRDVSIVSALTLARIGDYARAKNLAGDLEKSHPSNIFLNVYWLPTINAAMEVKRGNSAQALTLLEAAAPYEAGSTETSINYLYPAYVRGQAYLLAHNGPAAAAEFQKLLDHRGIVVNFVTGALARLQLGRAYALSGDTVKARTAYQDFFALWKNADPDIPILKEAKAEYAKIQ